MLFNSYEFLFIFLPLTVVAFFCTQQLAGMRAGKVILVIASLVFYSLNRLDHLAILLVSIAVNFLLAQYILKQPKERTKRKWSLTAVGVFFNLALLGWFKYFNFVAHDVIGGEMTAGWPQVALPIAISFFTFQQIAFLVDARNCDVREIDLLDYALFVTFFPQLIAGPIVHHNEMMPQFARTNDIDWTDIAVGLTLLSLGLFKKVVLADSVAVYASPVFGVADSGYIVSSIEAWLAALAYTLQLYFDFSGYSDMAIGLARMFGIKLPTNFYSPYKSTSIIGFWRRWHMTLSRFLRDYLYIPLGGSRVGEARRYLNLFITMVLGGIWHGAGWTFLVWGALHGFYLVCNHLWLSLKKRGSLARLPKGPRWFKVALTLFVVVLAWVYFRATTISGGTAMITAMLGLDGSFTMPADMRRYIPMAGTLEQFGVVFVGENIIPLQQLPAACALVIGLLALALFAPNTHQIMRHYNPTIDTNPDIETPTRTKWHPNLFGLLLAVGAAGASTLLLGRASEFLYFQF